VLQYTTALTLVEGRTYSFKVEARNAVGFSAMSTSVSILAGQPPSTPAAPITTLIGSQTLISWDQPDDGGTPITSYVILIELVSGESAAEELEGCDGSLPEIVAARQCYVQNKALNAAPFNLVWGSSVRAQIKAINIIGGSPYSDFGNGAVLLNGPYQPLNFREDRSKTTAY